MEQGAIRRSMSDDPPIEHQVGDALSAAEETVALAESCTGGLITSLLTDVPGASRYVSQGLVAYAYDPHRTLVGVSRETLDAHGAVSEASAREMAQTARDRADTTWGLAATGICGPGGGSPEKPVGTAYIAIAYAGEWGSGRSETVVEHHEVDGNRRESKRRIAREALRALHEAVTVDR